MALTKCVLMGLSGCLSFKAFACMSTYRPLLTFYSGKVADLIAIMRAHQNMLVLAL